MINYPLVQAKFWPNRLFHVPADLAVRLGGLRDVINNLQSYARRTGATAGRRRTRLRRQRRNRAQLALPKRGQRLISWINRTFDTGQSRSR